MACRARCRTSRTAVASASRTSLRSPRAHGAMAPSASDLVGSGTTRAGIEVPGRAQPLARRARAVRRVEREGARRHLGHADAAVDARHLAREQPVALVEAVDDDDVVGQLQGGFHRLGEAALDARAHDQPVHDDLDRVVLLAIELDVVFERLELAVDARLGVAALDQRRQFLLELALPAAHQRRQDVDAFVLGVGQHQVDDAFERLAGDLEPAIGAVRHADVGKQQPQVVVDLGDRAHGRPRVAGRRLLLDRDGRRQALDQVDVGLLHLLEKLAGVGRQRLDVAPLALGVDRVEGEARLARAAQPGEHHQTLARQVDVDVLQVVNARAAYCNPVLGHVQP